METVREMTFEEEAVLYEKEALAEFAKENGDSDSEGVNNILRRGMRIIRKARELIGNEKPMTNADRIRAMSDEELAKFLDDCNSHGCVCPARDCRPTCHACIVDWLKQPAEVDDERRNGR